MIFVYLKQDLTKRVLTTTKDDKKYNQIKLIHLEIEGKKIQIET